jgi:hypothetical protein
LERWKTGQIVVVDGFERSKGKSWLAWIPAFEVGVNRSVCCRYQPPAWFAYPRNSHKIEVAGANHALYVSHPKEVAALIEEAALQAR